MGTKIQARALWVSVVIALALGCGGTHRSVGSGVTRRAGGASQASGDPSTGASPEVYEAHGALAADQEYEAAGSTPPSSPPAAAPAPPEVAAGTLAPNDQNGEQHQQTPEHELVDARQDALATFSVDVDTASYTLMRRDVRSGLLPRPDGVRVEEYVNFFRYGDAPPQQGDAPFAVHLESAPSYFGEGRHLLRVGIQGMEIAAAERPATNLVFLVDVSGSMNSPDKLGLLQFALSSLVESLRPEDTVGIVVYAGEVGTRLEPTEVRHRGTLEAAIESLTAGGSTNGEGGIRRAYELALQHFIPSGINRVILCTDGDFNVGLTGDALIRLIEEYRDRRITLTTLGFGRGNYNDRDMELLADRGNGNYAYIDNRDEALRVLQRDLGSTLQVIAKDVKVQVEFNTDLVRTFRVVGYDNRRLAHQDFANDRIDAAEIGAGHFVTAFIEYELEPNVRAGDSRKLAEVRLRYKQPEGSESRLIRHAIALRDARREFEQASPQFRFGAAVAEFAEILRRSEHSAGARFVEVAAIARGATWNQDEDAQEFVELVERASRSWQ
jgi:Ca-activated chloride channel family protein